MLKDFLRLIKILHIFLKARIDSDLKDFNAPIFLRIFFFISPWRLYSSKTARGIRLKKAFDYAKKRKEASKKKTIRLRKAKK